MATSGHHVVAVVGGAISGSVAAEVLADAGVEVVVFEQNARPYGKIEDGLPRWHVHQRRNEYDKIDARLKRPDVHFVPLTRLGRDLSFDELKEDWGLSAILLANGAWRDRPFPVSGADLLVGKGLAYQNALIYWFNHKEDPDYQGPSMEIPDGTVVFGGGLASIDVCKVCQLETYQRALEARGVKAPMLELEKKGIAAFCERHGIDPAELGVKGCLLLYRRRLEDMPLAQPPEGATEEQIEKTIAARRKLLEIAQRKYLFRVQDRTIPLELVVREGRVAGVKVSRTKVEGRKVEPVPGSEETIETDLVISSIGSLPERIQGIAMKGEVYTFRDLDLGTYEGCENVFGVGNVVTGKGNIRASLVHAKGVAEHLVGHYLRAANAASALQERLSGRAPLPPEQIDKIRKRVKALQQRVGYDGDYEKWIAAHAPPERTEH